MAHIHRICHELEQTKPAKKTDVGEIMHEFADRIKKRGIIIIVSDLLDKPQNILEGLNHLRFARHEVMVMHVMDPFELEFRSTGTSSSRGWKVTTDHVPAEDAAQELPRGAEPAHSGGEDRLRRQQGGLRADQHAQPLEIALQSFLQSRALRRVEQAVVRSESSCS